jgi:glycosyltransferase involved in cell wall biosynthesis
VRIAYDITETCQAAPTGCGQFTRHTVRAMLEANRRYGWGDFFSLHYRASHARSAHLGYRPGGSVLSPLPRMPFRSLDRAEIIHGFATHAPGLGKARRVVTLFDVFSALEESRRWQAAQTRRRKIAQYKRLARRCDMILAISETTRRDFLRRFAYPEHRIRVVHGGVSPAFCPQAASRRNEVLGPYRLPERYFLYVGAPIPRKNLPRLVDAYAASSAGADTDLVVAGGLTAETESLRTGLRDRGLEHRVHFIGYVEDEAMPALYACAEALLFPTFYEGFGMPVLEAMASGIPVVIGNRGAAPEIAGDHAIAIDPEDTEALRRAIDSLSSRRPDQRQAAIRHASGFRWDESARAVREAYLWLMDQPRLTRHAVTAVSPDAEP